MHRVQPFAQKAAGTGAALDFQCGFRPQFVLVLNVTQLSISCHVAGMADAQCLQVDDSGSNATDVINVSSGGITLFGQGFRLGTNSALNTASDELYVLAM